jgi:hypothetical protein
VVAVGRQPRPIHQQFEFVQFNRGLGGVGHCSMAREPPARYFRLPLPCGARTI